MSNITEHKESDTEITNIYTDECEGGSKDKRRGSSFTGSGFFQQWLIAVRRLGDGAANSMTHEPP